MPAANIEVNGVTGSDDDVPINTLVQLSNADVGGESTYLWEILDQPDGTADALSSSAIENPTFTPTKEGSYLLRLTVNDGLATEVSGTAIVAVRHLRTNERIPAALETTEVDTAKGWKPAVNSLLALAETASRDANLVVVKMPSAAVPAIGDVVRFSGTGLIKTGLPGEERLLVVDLALAATAAEVEGPLAVIVDTPTGDPTVADGIAIARRWGLVEVDPPGSPAVGDPVYVSDFGTPALIAGTTSRVIGRVVDLDGGAGTYYWLIDGSVDWP